MRAAESCSPIILCQGRSICFRCWKRRCGKVKSSVCRWRPQAQAVKKLTFMRYSGKVKPGRYGIPVPDGEETVPPDGQTLCIVPGLACRPDGVRLGYGGGYYDRFLAGFPGFSLGVFYSGFIDEELPADAHDVPCGIIVTEG